MDLLYSDGSIEAISGKHTNAIPVMLVPRSIKSSVPNNFIHKLRTVGPCGVLVVVDAFSPLRSFAGSLR